MPLIDPEDYPTTPRGYRHPPDDVGGVNVANDVPADVTRLAEDIDADVTAVAAAAAGATSGVAGDLADHEATSTNVHGIPDTSVLVTTARTVSAGTGLTGGGTLAADRTIGIAAGGVGTTQLADDSVTTAKIAAGAVGTTDIADDAVTQAKIGPGAVGTTELANDAVTTAKIANDTIVDDDINAAAAIAPTKISGTAVVTSDARLSDTRTPTDNTVTTAKIADLAVTDAKLAGSITPSKVAGTAVVQARTIGTTGSLTGGGDLSANRTLDVADGGIGTAELANNAVTTAKVADGAITLSKLDPGASVVPAAVVGNLSTANVATGTDELGTTDGFTPNAGSQVTSSTAYAHRGSRSASVARTNTTGQPGVGLIGSAASGVQPVTSGSTYTAALHFFDPGNFGRGVQVRIYWWTSAGNVAASTARTDSTVVTSSDAWARLAVTGVAPVDAAFASVVVIATTATWEVGQALHVDSATFHRGAGGEWVPPGVPVPNLGSRANPADPTQVQIWNPGNSTWITV